MVPPPRAPLEDWLRDYYFTNQIDIGSSGVQPYSMAELRAILGISPGLLDEVVFAESHSRGAPELRAAVAAAFRAGGEERVLITNGSCEAEYLFMTTFLRPGDEVVVLEPAYHMLNTLPQAVGCRITPWRLRPEDDFRPDLDELEALVTSRTRAVIVNFPHNPTGVSLDRDGQRRLLEIVARAGTYLVWDQAFHELVYAEDAVLDPAPPYERFVSFNTLSKAYGLPGLRVGWAIMAPELIAHCVALRDYISYALSPLVERFALHAVHGSGRLLASRLRQARANRLVLGDWLHRHRHLVQGVLPTGGVTAFPRLPGVADVDGFCHRLMGDYGVLLVPGSCFDMPAHVRLGFGGPAAEFREGLARLCALLHEVSAGGAEPDGCVTAAVPAGRR